MVVVAAGRDEQRTAAIVCDNVEAQHPVVECLSRAQVGYVQVDMADRRPWRQPIPGLIVALKLTYNSIEIERVGRHLNPAVRSGPLRARAVTVDFDPVAVRVVEVQR